MKAKPTFLASMTLAVLCLAWSGYALADNVSNRADPSKQHHYANPDGKLAFSDPNNVMPGHYSYRYYVDQVARAPELVVWESPGPSALELYPVSQTVSTPPQTASAPPSSTVVVPGSSTPWIPVNPGSRVIITTATTAQTSAAVSTPAQTPKPVNKAKDLIGMKVKNQNNQKLGEIKDVVVDPQSGRVDYVVMKKAKSAKGTGKDIAVPLTAFTPAPDGKHLILNADKQQVASASGFSKKNYPAMSTPVYGAQPASYGAQGAQPAADTQPQIIIIPVPVATPEHGQKPDQGSDLDQTSPSHANPSTDTGY
jgi:sporulation protein YlmC with PRC-barrel domain